MVKKFFGWGRRHPILFLVTLLLLLLTVAVAVSEPTDVDASQGDMVFSAGLIALIGLGVIWVLSKVADRKKGFKPTVSSSANVGGPHTVVQASTQPPVIDGSQPVFQTPQSTGAVRIQEPASLPGESAYEATSAQHVPTQTQPQKGGNITLHDMLNMSPTEFEEFCARALSGMGYKDMKRVGGAGDLQADLLGSDTHGRSTIVQCKRYRPGAKIGSPVIQTFIGMKSVHHRADRGIFITTADYSQPAVKLARQHDIVLIDGDDLVKIAGLVFVPKVPSDPHRKVRFCTQCGVELDSNENFCPECGAKVKR